MTPAEWQRIKQVMGDALDQPDTRSRLEFLSAACDGDRALQVEIDALFAHASDRLDVAADKFASVPADDGAAAIGQRLGDYELIREIGRGGMGTIYLARRADEEFEKEVAIKILKRGTDTEEVLRRFRAERQILAQLEHPNIARLIDAGTSPDGLPYFVMEYVDGVPITDFCDATNLNVRQRIELFTKVCAALHFAHQNLVVHRDLKPGNILITANSEPKLLDFGIAKLLSPGSDFLQTTIQNQQRFTPAYASPEQIRGDPVTTASDVYSLGALLYELVVGTPPHRFSGAHPSPTELFQVIVEREPPHVSSIARDLDTIVRKALSKEPQRRYAGVAALAEDLTRYLEGRPVRARPPTFAYRASRFVRRNKLGVALGAVILLTVVGGIISTNRQKARAERRFNDVRQLANSFMFELHDEIDKGPVKAKELLVKRASEYLDSLVLEAAGDMALRRELATAYLRIGDVQGRFLKQNLGDTKGALESYGKALSLYEQVTAREPNNRELQRELAISHLRLGEINMSLGKPADAAAQFRKCLAIMERLRAANPGNAALRADVAVAHRELAMVLGLPSVTNLGDTAGTLEHLKKAVALYESLPPEEFANRTVISGGTRGAERRHDLAVAYGDLAAVLNATGNSTEAIVYQQKALALSEEMLVEDPKNIHVRQNTGSLRWNVATAYLAAGNLAGALDLTRGSLSLYQELAAEDPNNLNAKKDLAQSYRNMARVLGAQKDFNSAIEYNSKALAVFQELVTIDGTNASMRRQLALTHQRQSTFLSQAGRLDEATEEARQAIEIGEALIAVDPKNATARNTLALSYFQLAQCHALSSKWREAKDGYERSLAAWLALRESGALLPADLPKIDEVTREIAKCDTEIARLP